MEKFLFFEDIHKFLNEEEQIADGAFTANVGAFWQNRPNMNFEPGVDDRKMIRQRTLNVRFFNIPEKVYRTLVQSALSPSKAFPSDNKKGYNLVYNCKNVGDPNDEKWVKIEYVIRKLESLGYQVPDIVAMAKEIPEEGKMEAVEQQASENWRNILAELGEGKANEAIQRFIQIFGKIYYSIYGHQLSFKNAQLILSQKPDATLVFTKRDWENRFHCTVNPDATEIYYLGPKSNKRAVENDYNKLKQAADARGVAFDRSKEHSGHSWLGMMYAAADAQSKFIPVIGYDKSDVTPIDPTDDRTETTYGMADNLTGEPNELTRKYMDKLYPSDGNEDEYNRIKDLISDNSKLYLTTLVDTLKKDKTSAALGSFLEREMENGNTNYTKLLSNALKKIADNRLEHDYKIAKPSERIPSRDRIVGEILYICGVWDATVLKTLQGGKVDKQTLIHESTIINSLMEMLEYGRNNLLKQLKQSVMSIEPKTGENNEANAVVNEAFLCEHAYCTPEKLIRDFNLTVVDNNTIENDFKEETKEVVDLMERMEKINKKLYF